MGAISKSNDKVKEINLIAAPHSSTSSNFVIVLEVSIFNIFLNLILSEFCCISKGCFQSVESKYNCNNEKEFTLKSYLESASLSALKVARPSSTLCTDLTIDLRYHSCVTMH